MKFLGVSALLLSSITLTFAGEVQLTLTVQGKPVGIATVGYQKTGGKYYTSTKLRTTVGAPTSFGGSGLGRPDGMPISSQEVRQTPAGKEVYDLAYGATSVTIKITKGGKTTTKVMPYPKSGSIKRSSMLWFIETRPKVGAVEVAWKIDNQTQQWKKSTTKYARDEQITVGGKRVTAHVIEQEDGRMFTDDHGLPYRIEVGNGVTLERK